MASRILYFGRGFRMPIMRSIARAIDSPLPVDLLPGCLFVARSEVEVLGQLSPVIALHCIASSGNGDTHGDMIGRRALLSRVAIVFYLDLYMLLLAQFMCVFLTQIGVLLCGCR